VNRARAATASQRRDGWGVTGRLLLLIGVPLLGMLILAASITMQRLETTDRTRTIATDADWLGRLVDARAAIHAERVPTESFMRAGGIQADTAFLDALARLRRGRGHGRPGAADVAVSALGDEQSIVSNEELRSIRSDIDDGTATSDQMAGFYSGFDTKLQDAIDQSLIGIRFEADNLAGSSS
jgi:hypothetical protein